MLTGDQRITSGEVFVEGIRLKTNMMQVRSIIGYCPQFDALLDDLTGSETLEIFAPILKCVNFDKTSRQGIDLSKAVDITKKFENIRAEIKGS